MEKLEMLVELTDLLTINTDDNKAPENKALLRKLKQLIKKQDKLETNLEVKADSLPFEGISVVGNKAVTLKFNLETKEAVVSEIHEDGRDTGHKNYMAVHHATLKLKQIGKDQREG